MQWTFRDECAAFLQGWNIFRGCVGRELAVLPFQTDEEALQFVQQRAREGDELARKAMQVHNATLQMHERARKRKEGQARSAAASS